MRRLINLNFPGLGGSPKVVDVGGPPFLLPLVQREKLYDIQTILPRLNYNHNQKAFVIGAGAGPWPQLSHNCEVQQSYH